MPVRWLALLWVIDKSTPIKLDVREEELGLDESLHGETAYLTDEMPG